jgi:hypothetical protein
MISGNYKSYLQTSPLKSIYFSISIFKITEMLIICYYVLYYHKFDGIRANIIKKIPKKRYGNESV